MSGSRLKSVEIFTGLISLIPAIPERILISPNMVGQDVRCKSSAISVTGRQPYSAANGYLAAVQVPARKTIEFRQCPFDVLDGADGPRWQVRGNADHRKGLLRKYIEKLRRATGFFQITHGRSLLLPRPRIPGLMYGLSLPGPVSAESGGKPGEVSESLNVVRHRS